MTRVTRKDSADNSSSVSAGGGAVTLALVSTYIAEERNESSALGYWAEIAQAFSVGALIFAVVVLIGAAILLLVASIGRN